MSEPINMTGEHKDATIARLVSDLDQANSYIARIERDNEECRAIMAACHKMTAFEIPYLAVLNLLESAQ